MPVDCPYQQVAHIAYGASFSVGLDPAELIMGCGSAFSPPIQAPFVLTLTDHPTTVSLSGFTLSGNFGTGYGDMDMGLAIEGDWFPTWDPTHNHRTTQNVSIVVVVDAPTGGSPLLLQCPSSATVGVPYSDYFVGSGGNGGPYQYGMSADPWPDGLAGDSDG